MQEKKAYLNEDSVVDSKSVIDMFYTKISRMLDNHLEKNKEKIASNPGYAFLQKTRDFYISLEVSKQKSFTFLISSFLVFVAASLLFFSFSWGLKITIYWISFIALNQVSIISSVIRSISDIVIFFAFVFLPESLKQNIASLAKYIVIILLSLALAWLIAPIYLAFRILSIFVDVAHENQESINEKL